VTDRRDKGSDFRFEKTIKPDEDPKEAETRWYRWNNEEKRWEFYGNEMPSWDELSERNKDTFVRAYDFIFRSYYRKKRTEAVERGMDPQELPENPETMLDILYYLDKVKKHEAADE
jgi:hypothetical protein